MKFCSQCGAANEDDMTICFACGAMLEADTANTGRQRRSLRIPRPVLVIGCIVLAVVLIVGGIILAVTGLDSGIGDALGQTMKEFGADKRKPTQFEQFFAVANERLEDGEYSMYASFSGSVLEFDLDTDYSRSAQELQGEMRLDEFSLDFSAKKDIVQIRFPGEYDIYGFDVDNINKITGKFNDMLNLPIVGNLLPVRMPTDLELDLFAKNDLKSMLEGIAGEEYQAFMDSVKVERWNDETIVRGGISEECRVHKISWKSEALTDFLGALSSGGIFPNVGGLVNALLPEMDPYVYCYVNSEDFLVGIRFNARGAKCFFLLQGRENLWDSFTLTAETMSGETKVYQGGRIRDGEAVKLYLNDESGVTVISISYDDGSGDFSLYTAEAGTLVTGQVTGKVGEAGIRLYWELPELGRQELCWTITKLRRQPQQLGEKYSDLTDLAWSVVQSILIDLLTN